MKRILVVANDFPYPPDHGAAVDMWDRILTLEEMGYSIDLLASAREMPSKDRMQFVQKHVENLWVVLRKCSLRAILSFLPFQVRSRTGLQNSILGQRYDAVILEAEHVAAFLKNPAARKTKLILRIHNNETRYFSELAKGSESLWKKIFYYSESFKFRVFTPFVRKKCDALWFISDFERKEYVRNNRKNDQKSIFLPPHIGKSDLRPFSANGKTALFVGTLTIPHNSGAVEWYIKEIHPILSDLDGYSFQVAGHTAGHPIPSLTHLIQQYRNVSLEKDPIVLNSLYENAAVFVNPVIHGAGVKLKIIHAIKAGIPVVSTSVGIEGTGLENTRHLLVADTALEFAYCVQKILTNQALAKSLVQNAQTFLAERYDMKTNLQKILPRLLEQND